MPTHHPLSLRLSQLFFIFDALSLTAMQSIFLLRTLSLWNGYTKLRYCATLGWLASSGLHFVVSGSLVFIFIDLHSSDLRPFAETLRL